jgi:hypothetical protein
VTRFSTPIAERSKPLGGSGPHLPSTACAPSAGRTGSCFDNAVAESFFATLKNEIGTTVWGTRNDVRREVFAYLGCYNHDRLHSTLSYRTPTRSMSAIVKVSPSWHEIRCPVFGDNLT